jgi:hypothetical protein
MKKQKISTGGLQSTITNPLTPTNECPSGLNVVVEALSSAYPKSFPIGTPINLRVQATGCTNGVRVIDNGALLGVGGASNVTYVTKQPVVVGLNQTSNVQIAVLDAAGATVRTFNFSSDPYNIAQIQVPTASCQLSPGTTYRSSQGGSALSSLPFKVTSSVAGRLTNITSPDTSYILGNVPYSSTNPLALEANKESDFIYLNVKSQSGVVRFEVTPTGSSTPVSCDATIVVSSCGNAVFGDFDGDSYRDWLNRDCRTGNFLVQSSGQGYGTVLFGSLPVNENYAQMVVGKVLNGAYDNLLLVGQQTVNNVTSPVFKVGVSTGQAFNFIACTLPSASDNFVLNDVSVDNASNVTKIIGIKDGIRYERALTVSATGCQVGAATQQASSIFISASPNPVRYNESTVVYWGATNIQNYTCSVQKCTGSDLNTCAAVAGHQNIPTVSGSIVSRLFVSDALTSQARYKVVCTNGLNQSADVTIQSGTGPFFGVRSVSNGAYLVSPAFIRPGYTDGSNYGGQTASTVYLDWNVSGAGACSLVKTPVGGSATTTSSLASVASNYGIQVSDSTAITLSCQGSASYSSTLNLNVGGSPMISGGATSLSFPSSAPNATTAAKSLLIGAVPKRGKIKIYKVVVMSNVVNFDPFAVAVSANVSPSFTATGCENAVQVPGATPCTVNIAYKAGAFNSSANGKVVVVYKRFNGDVEMAGSSTIVSGYEADFITTVAGSTRAQVCDAKGRNCH